MTQTWHELLFAHWPLAPAALQACVPAGLSIDTWGGTAWLGVVVFRLSGVRLRGLPPAPGFARFPEINLRTYVTRDGKPGVLFLSLDADAPLVPLVARPWFRLAYHSARIAFARRPDGIHCAGRRCGAAAGAAAFAATYRPVGPVVAAAPGTLAHWLTERYCYYSADRRGRLYCCDIHHAPWPLQRATATIAANTLPAAPGLTLPPGPPLLHYAHTMRALIWPVHRLSAPAPAPQRPVGWAAFRV